MTNNERFCQLLNSCPYPRAVYAALLALGRAGILDKARESFKGISHGRNEAAADT